MKLNQKLKVIVESMTFIVKFEELDPMLLPLARRLEQEGDIDGRIIDTVNNNGLVMCVQIGYADKRRGPANKIFGYPKEVLLGKQYE